MAASVEAENARKQGQREEEEEAGSEEEMLSAQNGALGMHASAGRWRLQVSVPHAAVQDLLPAVQLLSSANKPNVDYKAAKAMFLAALQHAADMQRAAGGAEADAAAQQVPLMSAILAEDLRRQVCKVGGREGGRGRWGGPSAI
jgi:hypothetical protein